MSNIQLVLDLIKKPKLKARAPPKASENVLLLLGRLQTDKWLYIADMQLLKALRYLRIEIKTIEHLQHCRMCQLLTELDVERYNGTRSFWYVCTENSDYLEEEYPDCPKEENYVIDNYWAQVERYRKTGTCESDEVNTLAFILDRAKWAYKIMGKQVHLARQLHRLIRNWNYSERCNIEYTRVYEELGMYEIASPELFLSG